MKSTSPVSLAAATLAAAALALPTNAAAQPDRHRGPRGGQGPGFNPEMIERIASEIGVDDVTVRIIKDEIYKANKEAIGIRAELDGAGLELRRMMDADKPNISEVLRQVEKVGALETKVKKNRIKLMLTVRSKLSPTQQRQLHGAIRRHHNLRRRGGPGPQGGPGPRRGRGGWGGTMPGMAPTADGF